MEINQDDILITTIDFSFNRDVELINSSIEKLVNSNAIYTEDMAKINFYRTEFYNLFMNPKTKWLIQNHYVRLYVKVNYTNDKNTYIKCIPLGYIYDSYHDSSSLYYNNEQLTGNFKAIIYKDIAAKFKRLITKDGKINIDLYKPAHISHGDDLIMVVLNDPMTDYASLDEFMTRCNKLIKFANEYVSNDYDINYNGENKSQDH